MEMSLVLMLGPWLITAGGGWMVLAVRVLLGAALAGLAIRILLGAAIAGFRGGTGGERQHTGEGEKQMFHESSFCLRSDGANESSVG
jgi:hypothetical protein